MFENLEEASSSPQSSEGKKSNSGASLFVSDSPMNYDEVTPLKSSQEGIKSPYLIRLVFEANDEHNNVYHHRKDRNLPMTMEYSRDIGKSNSNDIILKMDNCYKLYDNLVFVKPHKVLHNTKMRPRWVNKTLVEILGSEFKMPKEVVTEMIEENVISVKTAKPNSISLLQYKLRPNDQIVTVDWKNEKPVLYPRFIKVLYHDDKFLVIDKPTSIPVHPAGRFVKNTLHHILEMAYSKKLYLLHRLDKVTSGILIHTWNAELATIYGEKLKGGSVTKCYLAQVYGDFPEITTTNTVDLNGQTFNVDDHGFIHVKNKLVYHQNEWTFIWRAKVTDTNESHEEEPTNSIIDTAYTLVKRIYYNSSQHSSIVLCVPITGRTHQIREHLRVMGYPIINDVGFELTNEKAEQWENPWPEKWSIMKQFKDDDDKCAESLLKMQFERHHKQCFKEGDFFIHLHSYYYAFHDENPVEFISDLPNWCQNLDPSFQQNIIIDMCRKINSKATIQKF